MKEMLKYRDYFGSVSFSPEDNILHGKIECINDLVTFEAKDVDSIRAEFEAAVDDYLETCAELGKEPDRTFSGSFNVRVNEELHRKLHIESVAKGVKLNSLIREILHAHFVPSRIMSIKHEHVYNHIVETISPGKQEVVIDQWKGPDKKGLELAFESTRRH